MATKKKIAVIGAGISGLTCAYTLQKEGHDVVVYEKEAHVGGRMRSREKNHLVFDIGADHLCNLYTHSRKYCTEFGIGWEKMRFLKYGIIRDKKIVPLKSGTGWLSRTRLLWLMFKTKKETDFFNLSSATKYDTDNAYHYIKEYIGQDGADYMVDPFTSTYQFHRADEISLSALKGILESIKYHKEEWYLHRTKNGMRALPMAFADQLVVKTDHPIKQVVSRAKSVRIVSSGEEKFDAVVLATTANVTKKIFKNPSDDQRALLDSTRYSSTISVALLIDKDVLPNDYGIVWVPYVESTAISGYVNEKFKGEDLIHRKKTLLNVWLHEEFAQKLLKLSDEEIYSAVISELRKVCPWIKNLDKIKGHDLQRWPQAMPKFSRGYITHVKKFLDSGQGKGNVFFCGDYLNSPWVEGSLRCGERVAHQVINSFSDQQ